MPHLTSMTGSRTGSHSAHSDLALSEGPMTRGRCTCAQIQQTNSDGSDVLKSKLGRDTGL